MKGVGFTTGGLNFEANVRRQSIDHEDVFHSHTLDLDAMAQHELDQSALAQFLGSDESH